MLLLSIDRDSPVPAYRQVCDQIIALTERSALKPGDRLPPSRSLAVSTGLHRSSIVRAYGELHALGYTDSQPGGYTTIRQRPRPPTTHGLPTSQEESCIDWQNLTRRSVRALQDHAATTGSGPIPHTVIDFDRMCADPRLAPDDDLRRCVKHILVRTGGAALDYASAAGWEPLREVIAARMCNHGVAITTDKILVTHGAQQALDLVFRCLLRTGDQVVVEAPSYGMAHALLSLHGARPLEVPMLADGMDLDHLQKLLENRNNKPRLVFTMPNFQNPTGISTTQPHRERLLALCEQHGIPLVEDGFEEEMKYFGKAVLPIKSMDSKGIVIYVGTFSKVVFPGLRVGWIAAPRRIITHLTDVMRASCISGNTLAQAAAARYCGSGEFEQYMRRVHRVFRHRMQTLLQGLERCLPKGVNWTRPNGGYTAWLTLNGCNITEETLVGKLLQAGVKTGPGSRYFYQAPKQVHLRLSIACVSEEEIEAGCRMLGRVLNEVC